MWCVLVCDSGEMAADVIVVGSYRSREKASEMADAINRKIEIHSPARNEAWTHDGEPNAWVQEMRVKRTEVYESLGIRRLS